MLFIIGISLAVLSALLTLKGVSLDNTIGTVFLLLVSPLPVALGYWSASQGLVVITSISQMYYTTDKDLDNTSSISQVKEKGELLYVVDYLLWFETRLVAFKAAIIGIIAFSSFNLYVDNSVIQFFIKMLSLILGFIIVICMFNQIKQLEPTKIIIYILSAVGVLFMFSLVQAQGIAVFNSIPLLLGIVFSDLPFLYGDKEPIIIEQHQPRSFNPGRTSLDFNYLFVVIIANLGIGTSKLANFVPEQNTSDVNNATSLSVGKHLAAFISSLLWLLFSSTRSAVEESVTTVQLSDMLDLALPVMVTMVCLFIICKLNIKAIIDVAESPFDNKNKTIVNIALLYLLFALALSPAFNPITAFILCGLGIGLNVIVNKFNVPNSALSFVTTWVPITGMLF